MTRQAFIRKGVYWHIFPSYGEAFDSIWNDPAMLFNIIPKELIDHVNITNLSVYFINGSIYQLKGADKPDSLRGPNPFGVVLDELDTMKSEAWDVLQPILRANNGFCWFVGTPRGRTQLYDFYNKGQEEHHEWKSWLLKASESGIIPTDQLVEARKSMTENLYNQEFECAFLESEGSVFRGVRDIMISKPQPPIPGRMYLAGIDLAKVQDWTVIRIYDRETNELVYYKRWQTLEWPFQKKMIKVYTDFYNNAQCVIDATGIGDPICDDLIRAGVSVIPFKITGQNKKDLIEKLSLWIEQKKFKMFKDAEGETLLEYDNFSYKIGSTGQAQYGARSGYFDDIIMADSLAVWHLNTVYIPEFTVTPTSIQIALARAKMQYTQKQEQIDEPDMEPDFDEWSGIGMNEGGYL